MKEETKQYIYKELEFWGILLIDNAGTLFITGLDRYFVPDWKSYGIYINIFQDHNNDIMTIGPYDKSSSIDISKSQTVISILGGDKFLFPHNNKVRYELLNVARFANISRKIVKICKRINKSKAFI